MESPTVTPKAVKAVCESCDGRGRRPVEWDVPTGAAVVYQPCGSCLGQRWVLVNAPAEPR